MTFGSITFKKTTRLANRKFTPLWLLVSGAALEACGSSGSSGTGDLAPFIIEADSYSFDGGETIDNSEAIFDVDAVDPNGDVVTFKIASQTDNTDDKNKIELFAIDITTGEITFVAGETPDYENPGGEGVVFSSLADADVQVRANTYIIKVVAEANGLTSGLVTYTVRIADQPDAAVLADNPDVEPASNIVAPSGASLTPATLEIPVAEFLTAFVDPDTNPLNQITHLSFDFAALPTGVTLQYDSKDIDDGVSVDIRDGGVITAKIPYEAIIADGAFTGAIILSYSGAEGPEGQDVIVDGGGVASVASLTFYVNHAPTISSVTDVADTIIDNNAIEIDENTDAGVAVFKIRLDDADGHVLEYSLDGDDVALFKVERDSTDPNIAIISFLSSPDFEAPEGNVYEVTIVATDTLTSEVTRALTVTINDQNEAPFNIELRDENNVVITSDENGVTTTSIDENKATTNLDTNGDGTLDSYYCLIGIVSYTDPDTVVSFTNNTVSIDSTDFYLDADNKLYLTTLLNYETTTSYSVTITVQDAVDSTLTTSKTITITVNDINEAPKLVGGSFEVGKVKKGSDDGAGVTVSISDLLARYSDEDADDSITRLEITGISADGDPITPGDLTLTHIAQGSDAVNLIIGIPINLPLDASILGNIGISIDGAVDDGTLFVITYKIYDSGDIASVENTIEFSAVTSIPVQFDSNVLSTVSVDENSATDTIVATVTATPEDVSLSIVYSLAGGGSLFTIDSGTGDITLLANGDLDFEADAGPQHTLTITATVIVDDPATDDPFDTFVLTVNVEDINEAPIGIEIQDENGVVTTSIAENLAADNDVSTPDANYYLVGTVAVTDPDTSEAFNNNLLVVTGTDSSMFEIINGKLYLTTAPDYETAPTSGYSISIVANQGVTDLEFATPDPIVITVVNADDPADVTVLDSDNAVVTDFDTQISVIAENVPITTVLYTFSGTDEDDGETVKFELSATDATDGIFQIDADSGVLTFVNSPDFEATGAPSYDVEVIAYSVNTVSGNRIDDQIEVSRTVKIEVTDVAEPAVVTVLDSNNAEVTDFINTPPQILIAENVPITTDLYTFSGTDEDAGETVKFKLSATDTTKGIFQIVTNPDGTASVLRFKNSPDFEDTSAPANNIYSVEVIFYSVTLDDSGDDVVVDLSEVPITVKIEVTNADDLADVTVRYNAGGAVINFDTTPVPVLEIAENVDTVLYTFTGRDDDAGETVKFELLATDSIFEIGTDSAGTSFFLTFVNPPDFEDTSAPVNNIYSVEVIAYSEDASGRILGSDVSTIVEIKVTDVAELAVVTVLNSDNVEVTDFINTQISIAENVDPDLTVLYTFSGTDEDADETVKFELSTTDATDGIFQIDADSGVLTFVNSPDFEDPQDADTDAPGNNIYSVEVIAYSVNTVSGNRIDDQIAVSRTVKIEVTGVNEVPFFILPDGLPADSSIAGSFFIGPDDDITTILTVSADDPDANDVLTYSTSDGDFEVSATGELSFTPTSTPTVGEYLVTITVTDAGSLVDTIDTYVSVVDEVAKHQVLFAPQGTDSISFSDLVGFAAVTGKVAEYITFTGWGTDVALDVALLDSNDQTISLGTPVAIQAGSELKITNNFPLSSYEKDSLIRYFVNYDDDSSKAVVLGIDIDGTQPMIDRDSAALGDAVDGDEVVYLNKVGVGEIDYVAVAPLVPIKLASYTAPDLDADTAITYKLYYQTSNGDYVEILSTDTLFGFAAGDSSDVVLKSGADLILTDTNLVVNARGIHYKIVVAAFDSVTVDYDISKISPDSITSFEAYLELLDPYFKETEISLDENTLLSQLYTATAIADPTATIAYSIKDAGSTDDGLLFVINPNSGSLTFADGTFKPDFEKPQGAITDNIYTLTVIASYTYNDGTTDQILTREQVLTINIIDVEEVPEFKDPADTVVTIDGSDPLTPIPGTILIDDLAALFTDQDADQTIARINFKPLINIRLEYGDEFIDWDTLEADRYFVIDDGITDINVRNFLAGRTAVTLEYTVVDSAGSESLDVAGLTFTNIADSIPIISLVGDILPTADGSGGFYYSISISEHYADGFLPVFTSVDKYGSDAVILVDVDATDDDGVTAIEYRIDSQFDKATPNDQVSFFEIDSIDGTLTIEAGVVFSDDPNSQAGKEYSITIVAISDAGQSSEVISEAIELIVDITYLPEFVVDVENVVVSTGDDPTLSAIDDQTIFFTLAATDRIPVVPSTYPDIKYNIKFQEDGLGNTVDLFEMEAIEDSSGVAMWDLGGKVTLIAGKSLAYDANGENTYTITVVALGWDVASEIDETSGIEGDTLELTLTVRENIEIIADVTSLLYEKELGVAKDGHEYTLTGSDLFSLDTENGKTLLSYNLANPPAAGSYLLTLEERVAGVDGVDGDLVETLLFTATIVEVDASADVSVDAGVSYDEALGEFSRLEGTSLVVGDITIKTPDGDFVDETPGAGAVEYYFVGDNDKQIFFIDSGTGVITFRVAPDFENPFKSIVIEGTETLTQALVRLNTYNITVGATTTGDDPFYGSVVVRDLVIKVTDDSTDEPFILQDRGSSAAGDVTVSYKSDPDVEAAIQVVAIAGTHNDGGADDLQYHFIPAGTIILPILDSVVFTLHSVKDSTVDPKNPVDVALADYPFEIIDGNLVIANVDSALNDVDGTVAEGGVKVDEVRQVYEVVIGKASEVYVFDIKLSPFDIEDHFDADTITDISIFENFGAPLYTVPQAPAGYIYTFAYPLVTDPLIFDTPQDGLAELVMVDFSNLGDYQPGGIELGGSDIFDFDIIFTLIKDSDSPTDPDAITEVVTKSFSVEIKDAPIVKPQDLTSELVLVENSINSIDLKGVFSLALSGTVGYEDYIVTYAIAGGTPQNLLTITGAGTDQLSIDPNFDYETTLIPAGHSVGETGYSDGYLKHINTINITLDLIGTIALSSGDETATANLKISLGDDTDEIVFVSSSSATVYNDVLTSVFYVAKAVKESDSETSNPPTVYTYTISDDKNNFGIDINTGAVTVVSSSPSIEAGDKFIVIATGGGSTQEFEVTVSVDITNSQPANLDPVNFIHKGYTDIYAVENEDTDSLLYKIYNNTDNNVLYDLSGDDADFFKISATGELTFISSPDYEDPANGDPNSIYNVIINAALDLNGDTVFGSADDYSEAPISLNVHIVNVDDAPVFNEGDTDFVFVIGNDGYSSPLGVFAAIDDDGDTISYSIETGGDVFAIDQDGKLTFKAQPSLAGDLTGEVKASSTGSSGIELSDTIDFTVKVIDATLSTGSDGDGSSFEASDGDGDIVDLITVDHWVG